MLKIPGILLVSLLASLNAFAAPSASPTATTNTLSSGGSAYLTVANMTTPGNAVNDLTSINTAGGCFTTDFTFNNFAVTDGGDPMTGTPTTAGTYVYNPTGSNVVHFFAVRDCAAACTDDATNDFRADDPAPGMTNIIFVLSAANFNNGGVTLYLENWLNTQGTLSVDLYGCVGGAGQATTFTGCGGAGQPTGTFIHPINNFNVAQNAFGNGPNPVSVAVGGIASGTSIVFNLRVNLNGTGLVTSPDLAIDTYVWGIGLGFVDTPEPSTFVMLCTAFAGLGVVRWRRKSRDRQGAVGRLRQRSRIQRQRAADACQH